MKLVSVIFGLFLFIKENQGGRIIGGDNAKAGQFPYSAAITASGPGVTYFCGGALISVQYILTAGQCLNSGTSFTIILGSNYLSGTDPNRQIVATSNKIIHPDFNPLTLEHDIGLLKLHQPIELTDYIQTARLTTLDITEGIMTTAIGWGQIDDMTPGKSDALRYVTLTALSNEECKLTYGSQLTDGMVCLTGNYNEGSCAEDTGSPAIVNLAHLHWVLGVSSFFSGNGCTSTDPSGYTRVHPYLDWINGIINDV